jgi:hypothetical protein
LGECPRNYRPGSCSVWLVFVLLGACVPARAASPPQHASQNAALRTTIKADGTYFYGVPDSGYPANGHLFNASFHGNPWLTGGGFGPEASIFTLVLLAIWGVIFSVWLHGVRYPNPAAVQRPQGGSPTEDTAAQKL